MYLTNLCKKVHLIHRRDSLRAEKILQDRIFEKANEGKINLVWNNELKEIKGDGNVVTHLNLSNYDDIQVKGVFIAIGHNPNTEIFKDQIDMKDGYIIINTGLNGNVTGTSVPGVFAAGDVADSVYRQAITSAGFGCMAALDAQKFIDAFGNPELVDDVLQFMKDKAMGNKTNASKTVAQVAKGVKRDYDIEENMGDYYDPRQPGGYHDQPKTSNMQLARQCKEGDQAACKMLKKRLGKE